MRLCEIEDSRGDLNKQYLKSDSNNDLDVIIRFYNATLQDLAKIHSLGMTQSPTW